MQARDNDNRADGATPASRADLFAFLDRLGIITVTVSHAPVFTVDEARALRGEIAGGHCKCLFLKDKKGGLWLIVVDEARRVDLKALSRHLDAPRFSFANPDRLREALGVEPGSVTPFALINDRDQRVTVVLDQAMLANARLNYHPLANDATTTIASTDLTAFVAACGHEAYITDLETL
jgi:Ala-tRNA(Pro) deacylase